MTNHSWLDELKLKSGAFFFKYRNALFPLAFVLLFATSKPSVHLEQSLVGAFLSSIGIVMALLGQVFRLAVIGYAYIKRGGKDGKVYADHLVVRGFYNHSRNPMYVANIMIIVGFCMIYGSLLAYILVIPFFLFAYLSITVAEETYLRNRFGKEYEAYEKSVNRFWPDFKGIQNSLKEFEYNWKRALRKDYGTVFVTLGGILIIQTWKYYSLVGFLPEDKKKAFVLSFAILSALYLIARFLKKTKRLASSN